MLNSPVSLLDLTLSNPAENLALDEALLRSVEARETPCCLRLWESAEYAVVLGRSSRLHDEVHADACEADRVPVLRRCSGGGVVVLGPGCLVFSICVAIPETRRPGISESIGILMPRLADALSPLSGPVEVSGTSDLSIDGRKVSGNSQRWLRRTLLHHGTLLYDFDLSRISRYLKQPARQPGYRASRAHDAFVTNLPVSRDALTATISSAFQADTPLATVPLLEMREWMRSRYGSKDWHHRL